MRVCDATLVLKFILGNISLYLSVTYVKNLMLQGTLHLDSVVTGHNALQARTIGATGSD